MTTTTTNDTQADNSNVTERDIVVGCLSHSGAAAALVTSKLFERAYLVCNGFGTIGRAQALDQCWDWSHVRDSDDEGLRRAYLVLLRAGVVADAERAIVASRVPPCCAAECADDEECHCNDCNAVAGR